MNSHVRIYTYTYKGLLLSSLGSQVNPLGKDPNNVWVVPYVYTHTYKGLILSGFSFQVKRLGKDPKNVWVLPYIYIYI